MEGKGVLEGGGANERKENEQEKGGGVMRRGDKEPVTGV